MRRGGRTDTSRNDVVTVTVAGPFRSQDRDRFDSRRTVATALCLKRYGRLTLKQIVALPAIASALPLTGCIIAPTLVLGTTRCR